MPLQTGGGSNYLHFLIFLLCLHNLFTEVLITTPRSLLGPEFLQVLHFFHFSHTGLKLLKLGFHGTKKHFILRKLKFFGGLGHTAVAYNISFSVSSMVFVKTIWSYFRK